MSFQKPPAATSTRNLFGPRADRLLVCYAIDEQNGTTLNNLGLSSDYDMSIPMPHSVGTQRYDGNIFDDTDTLDNSRWFSNPDEGNYLYLKSNFTGSTQQYVQVLDNDSGSEITSTRGTMMIRFSIAELDNSSAQPIFNSGGTANTKGHRLICFRDSDTGYFRVFISESNIGSDYQTRLEFQSDVAVAGQIYTMIWTWGEFGFNAWLEGVEANLIQLPGPSFPGDGDFVDPRESGNILTDTYWSVDDGDAIRIGRNQTTRYGNIHLYAFSWWDVQLRNIEREELFCDPYISFRPKAKDYTGSGENSIFRTYVNPIPVRPRLNSDLLGNNKDEITFSVVTSSNISDDFPAFMRINYDTDTLMSNPIASHAVSSSSPNHQLNLVISGLMHATTYYYIAEYSTDGFEWYAFPGGKGKFKTQKRNNTNFDFAFWTDDHLCNGGQGGPPLESLNLGYGGDILDHIIANPSGNRVGHKWWLCWRSMYDIYTNQDVDFIIIGGDYYFGDNDDLYDGDTNLDNNPEKMAATYRNWCNLMFKCGICYFVQGNHENEAGYFQRGDRAENDSLIQMRTTIARKKFFPNPTNKTYPQGGEYETPHKGEMDWIPIKGNNWIPELDSQSSTEGTGLTPSTTQITYDQSYRNQYILGVSPEDPYIVTEDPHQLNRSPLENYFAWTWGNSLFIVIDNYRYTEPGDPLNTGGLHIRNGPVWTLGEVQKNWVHRTLANSKEKSKFLIGHQLVSGEAVNIGGFLGGWYGRGSGALIKSHIGVDSSHAYEDDYGIKEENPEEIELHDIMKQYKVTAYLKGHDHKFCHVTKEEVHYITGSSASAPSQWEREGIRNSYGHTEDQNNPIASAAALGIKATSNTRGYCIFRFTNNSWKCLNRHCAMSPHDFDTLHIGDFSDVRFGGASARAGPGWAGPIYTAKSTEDIITLSEVPWQVYVVCDPSNAIFKYIVGNLDADIWTYIGGVNPTYNFYTPTNDVWDEFYPDNKLPVTVPSAGDYHIMHVPQTTYNAKLLNAINEDQIPITLHAIHPNNTVFIYNTNVEESVEVAEYYREKRNLPTGNLVGLSMPIPSEPSSCETPISKSVFESTILEPLRSAISTLGDSQIQVGESGSFSCSAIILGYGTPLAYIEDDGEIIAIASRLHRINFDYEPKKHNHTYDRREFQFYNTEDSQQVCITAIIDGPTAEAAKRLIDRGINISNQPIITGKIVVDPYGLQATSNDNQYEDDVLDFIDNYAPNLGSSINTTVEIENPYLEPSVAFFKGESFYWGWSESSYSKDLFFTQSEKRVFLYNADNDAACQIHYIQDGSPFQPDGSDPWCNLAINIDPGYATCAGAVDTPGSDAYLRPRPFFSALQQGASIGEAFLFASPFVNWKTVLIGDPLTTVIFPSDIPAEVDPNDNSLPNNEVIRRMKEDIEESLAWGARQARFTKWLREFNVASDNIGEEIELLYAVTKWENRKNIQVHNNLLNRTAQNLLEYILATTGLTFPEWLTREQEKTSILLNNLLSQLGTGAVQEDTDDLIHNEGHWDYKFVYTHNRQTFEHLHFELQLSVDSDFTEIVINLASASDITGWQYEAEPYQFIQLLSDGFASNFSGRKIRFTSDPTQYLSRTDIFYVRWRALESDGITTVTEWNIGSEVIIIKR